MTDSSNYRPLYDAEYAELSGHNAERLFDSASFRSIPPIPRHKVGAFFSKWKSNQEEPDE
jgi:hypothetical protein